MTAGDKKEELKMENGQWKIVVSAPPTISNHCRRQYHNFQLSTFNFQLAYGLNLLDLLFTLHALDNGAMELNPLMRSVPLMIVYKVVILGALLGWLERRCDRLSRFGLRACAAVYGAVDIWHIFNIMKGMIL